MALVWPSSLPQTMNRQGFQRSAGDGRLVSPTEVGPGKVRRLTASVVEPVAGSMWMTHWQLERFKAWWRVDTKQGSVRFTFPAIGVHGFPFYSEDGSILLKPDGGRLLRSAWWLVQFAPNAGPPSWASIGDNTWEVSLNLEVMP